MTSGSDKSARGKWLVLMIFIVGGIALAGLFMAPRGKMPATQPASQPTAQ